jgi:hypothetical protein
LTFLLDNINVNATTKTKSTLHQHKCRLQRVAKFTTV